MIQEGYTEAANCKLTAFDMALHNVKPLNTDIDKWECCKIIQDEGLTELLDYGEKNGCFGNYERNIFNAFIPMFLSFDEPTYWEVDIPKITALEEAMGCDTETFEKYSSMRDDVFLDRQLKGKNIRVDNVDNHGVLIKSEASAEIVDLYVVNEGDPLEENYILIVRHHTQYGGYDTEWALEEPYQDNAVALARGNFAYAVDKADRRIRIYIPTI